MAKTCRKGHELTPDNRCPDGRCRTCKRSAARARYAKDDTIKLKVKEWRDANPERVKEHQRRSHANPNAVVKRREWAQRNPEKIAEYGRRSYLKDGEKIRARMRAYLADQRAADPAAAYRKTRAWVEANPERARLNHRIGSARRAARLREAAVLPFTLAQLDERMAYYGHRCWMCGGPFEHIDHVKPLARGGSHALMNLRPACATCNVRKGATWPLVAGGSASCR